ATRMRMGWLVRVIGRLGLRLDVKKNAKAAPRAGPDAGSGRSAGAVRQAVRRLQAPVCVSSAARRREKVPTFGKDAAGGPGALRRLPGFLLMVRSRASARRLEP